MAETLLSLVMAMATSEPLQLLLGCTIRRRLVQIPVSGGEGGVSVVKCAEHAATDGVSTGVNHPHPARMNRTTRLPNLPCVNGTMD